MQNIKTQRLKISLPDHILPKIVRAVLYLIVVITLAGKGLELTVFIKEAGTYSPSFFFNYFPLEIFVFSALGHLILKHHPKHTVGWLFLFVGFNSSIKTLVYSYMQYGESVMTGSVYPLIDYITPLGHMIWWPVLILPITLVLLYFPDGKLLSPRWRFIVFASLLGMIFGMLTAFHSEPYWVMDISNTKLPDIKVVDRFLAKLAKVSVGLIMIGALGSLTSVYIRFRRSNGIERLQMKWLVYGASISVIFMIVLSIINMFMPYGLIYDRLDYIVSKVLVFFIPAACGIAIIRHKLWDIDIVINRTLVYGALTTLIIAIYLVIVGGISILFQSQTNTVSGVAAAVVIAFLFQPLREQLQDSVNHMLYGKRNDPAAVLTRLAHHSETAGAPTAVLPNLVQNIAQMLKIPYVAIRSPAGIERKDPIAYWGHAANNMRTIPLTFQNEVIGNLVVAPRGPHEQFNQEEQELLGTIAALTATTLRSVQLSNELRQSRKSIITAREEERRRLRRDLHDGLGPQLASQVLGLEAVAQHIPTDPEKAQSLLGSLKRQAQEAILDVRRLVYDLRPPALDDLGLIGALRQSASRYETGILHFRFNVPEKLPELPAAVETAVYRIAQEAMTNVVRHAKASRCTVSLFCQDGYVILEVRDNGIGLPKQHRIGVGLQAMKERTTELNGDYVLEALLDGGTLVRAEIPWEVECE